VLRIKIKFKPSLPKKEEEDLIIDTTNWIWNIPYSSTTTTSPMWVRDITSTNIILNKQESSVFEEHLDKYQKSISRL